MPALHVASCFRPSRLLPAALAAALAGSAACSASRATDTSAAAQRAYGAEMAKKGFWHEALFRFQKAAALSPNDSELQNNLAVAFEATGDTTRALAAYRRALELAPEETHIRRNYARFAEYYTAAQRAGFGADAPAPTPTPPPMPTP